jgi:hypothetical protein
LRRAAERRLEVLFGERESNGVYIGITVEQILKSAATSWHGKR